MQEKVDYSMRKSYKLKARIGIDNLKGKYSGRLSEYWTNKQWDDFYAQKPINDALNKQYIQECKYNGTFGNEYEIEMQVEHNPLFDEIEKNESPMVSGNIVFLNFK